MSDDDDLRFALPFGWKRHVSKYHPSWPLNKQRLSGSQLDKLMDELTGEVAPPRASRKRSRSRSRTARARSRSRSRSRSRRSSLRASKRPRNSDVRAVTRLLSRLSDESGLEGAMRKLYMTDSRTSLIARLRDKYCEDDDDDNDGEEVVLFTEGSDLPFRRKRLSAQERLLRSAEIAALAAD